MDITINDEEYAVLCKEFAKEYFEQLNVKFFTQPDYQYIWDKYLSKEYALVISDNGEKEFKKVRESYTHLEMMARYAEEVGGDIEDIEDAFNDAYQGCFESFEAFTQDLYEQCEGLPTHSLMRYIDWKALWDCELHHDYFAIVSNDDELHFFRHI